MFTGGVGGSRHKLAEEGVSKRVSTAEEVFQAASPFRDNPTAIGELTQGDVDRLQVELTIRLGDLRVIADELGRDSASREAQMMQHRERAIIGEAK